MMELEHSPRLPENDGSRFEWARGPIRMAGEGEG